MGPLVFIGYAVDCLQVLDGHYEEEQNIFLLSEFANRLVGFPARSLDNVSTELSLFHSVILRMSPSKWNLKTVLRHPEKAIKVRFIVTRNFANWLWWHISLATNGTSCDVTNTSKRKHEVPGLLTLNSVCVTYCKLYTKVTEFYKNFPYIVTARLVNHMP
jgi:hypothetical protein